MRHGVIIKNLFFRLVEMRFIVVLLTAVCCYECILIEYAVFHSLIFEYYILRV